VLTPSLNELNDHTTRWMNILGRLKPGVTRAQAQVGLAPLWHALRLAELPLMGWGTASKQDFTGFVTDSRLHVLDGARGFSYSRNDVRDSLLATMAMAFLVLLMAAVNVASLVLVRAAGRAREIAMRYALGARRERVTRQLLTEGLLLGILGGTAGVAAAPAAIRLLVGWMSAGQGETPYSTHLDGTLLAFGFGLALAVSLLFTIAPVVQLRKPNLVGELKQQGAGSVGGRLGFRRAIVGVQVGLSLLLLVCAGLFVQTLRNLRDVNVGFATDHLITFGVDPALAGYSEKQAGLLDQQIVERLGALPGVVNAGATSDPELAGDGSGGNITIEGYVTHDKEEMRVEHAYITPGFFAALKVPLLAGRNFTTQDDASAPKVAIVNALFADHFFGSPEKAIGHMIANGSSSDPNYDIRIVGVTGNYIHRSVRDQVQRGMYLPAAQDDDLPEMQYYVRTWGAPATAMGLIRQAVRGVDAKLALDGLITMQGEISQNISDDRMVALLAVCFGALAMLLAAVGLYGVLAYATAQRTREIGVRMALGADRAGVMGLVLRDVLKLAGTSVVVALPVALLATRTLKSQLFGVSTMSPMVYVPVTLVVLLVAVMAAALPARRAASVEPVEALRTE
jgi:putative ABC transport system permease protein